MMSPGPARRVLAILPPMAVGWALGAPLLFALGATGALTASEQEDADTAAAQGLQAMRDADGDHHRAVDAAIAFSHALTIYKQLGEIDQVSDMQSSIFWCKKDMDINDLQDYLAKKGSAASTEFVAAQAVIDTVVPPSEADAYLARAQQFQSAHPQDHFQVAIHFSEIVERFPGTPAAATATPIFDHEETAYLQQVETERTAEKAQLAQAIDQIATTRFMLPPSVTPGTTAIPGADAQDKALTAIKAAYKDAYAVHTLSGKRTLSKRLLDESDANQDNAAYVYMMLAESARLAAESAQWETVFAAVEKQGAIFAGFDIQAHKVQVLARVRSDPVAAAIITLLRNPKDKDANLTAGRSFCFGLQRWDLGLPMLANATGDMKKVAQMELANPSEPGQQHAVADLWYELGVHAGGTDKIAEWTRAQTWYRSCQAGLGAIGQAEVGRRLDALEDTLPMVITDYSQLTPKQWNRMAGREIEIDNKDDRGDGEVEISDSHPVRVVPYPDDRDKMYFQVGSLGGRQDAGVLSGNGHLWVIPTQHHPEIRDLSTIRFKVVPVEAP